MKDTTNTYGISINVKMNFTSKEKTVQQIIIETYLQYRKAFYILKMISYGEYFKLINCINYRPQKKAA